MAYSWADERGLIDDASTISGWTLFIQWAKTKKRLTRVHELIEWGLQVDVAGLRRELRSVRGVGVGVEDIRKALVSACGKAKGYIYLTDGTS